MPSWPRINENWLFTPSVLIFTTIAVYFLAFQDFAEKAYQYSYLLGVAGVIMSVKVFIVTFAHTEKWLKEKKAFLLVLDLILAGIQLVLIFLAVNHLSQDKYPKDTLQWFSVASIVFMVQIFLGTSHNLIKYTITTGTIYGLSFLVLRQRVFEGNTEMSIFTQQIIAYLVLALEALLLFIATRNFVNLNITNKTLNSLTK